VAGIGSGGVPKHQVRMMRDEGKPSPHRGEGREFDSALSNPHRGVVDSIAL
jgi:hypothetical protein